jgi:hypothetical protein
MSLDKQSMKDALKLSNATDLPLATKRRERAALIVVILWLAWVVYQYNNDPKWEVAIDAAGHGIWAWLQAVWRTK